GVEHSTKWVEEVLDLTGVGGSPSLEAPGRDDDEAPLVLRSTTVEVNGKRFGVKMWVPEAAATAAAPARKRERRGAAGGSGSSTSAPGNVEAPMQGTIVKVLVEVGDTVETGQGLVVLEAMKMENQINADAAGTVAAIKVAVGDTVGGGDVLVVIE
ncbi:MAG: biotin/lipoyl-binding protein, partial [Acidimicrobiia bacterium]|nr:biotin/lipoyl-binding protein [Acidimicrobiia bacterium]